MKFLFAGTPPAASRVRRAAAGAIAAIFALAVGSCPAQTTTPPAPPIHSHRGKVIFSRSTDANGLTTPLEAGTDKLAPPQVTPVASQASAQLPAMQIAAAPLANDAERRAVTVTGYNLNVHLRPADQRIAVRAVVMVRNDGQNPLTLIPLQISSSLNWEEIRVEGPAGQSKAVAFQAATLNSDVDHTGQLHEAEIPLTQSLAPGASLQLDVTYAGQIAPSAQRLVAIGAPDDAALRSDWDQIGVEFTGLRGLGNVVWYPVVSVPVLLGDGARLFDELGEQKLRLSGAGFRLRLVDEFPHGQAPTVAVVNGHSVPLKVTESGALDQSQEVDGVATASLDSTALGFEAPSLFVAIRTAHTGAGLTAWTLPDNNVAVQFWTIAAAAATPFVESWLGKQPGSPLTLLDLPDAQDAPFETGALLAVPLREPDAKAAPGGLEQALVHALAEAWLTPSGATASTDQRSAVHPSDKDSSPGTPAWLDEGVATFMTTLWVEKKQGRDTALRMLEADRSALALAEPASPGDSVGQPLAQAVSPVYYRTKAAYVLWMLRDLVGDPALAAALRGGRGSVAGESFEKRLQAAAGDPDLGRFFADWVNADKGLPDLSITGVYPSAVGAGNWLVAVDLANSGYAAAEIPVTVRARSGSGLTSVTRRVRIPARDKITARILILGKPTSVQANDGTVPETEASIHITNLGDSAAEPASADATGPPQ